MKRLALSLAFIFWASAALAQYAGVRVVSSCGNPSPWPALQTSYQTFAVWLSVDTTMTLCTIGGGGGGGGGTSSTYGAAFPVNGTAAGFINFADGTMAGAAVSLWGTAPTGQNVLDVNANVITMPAITGAVTANLPVNVTPIDCSGTITTGGTAQNLASLGVATIHLFMFENIDSTIATAEPMCISFTGTAAYTGSGATFQCTHGSTPIAAPTATTQTGMGSFVTPYGFGSNHAVSVIAPTTGHQYTCTAQ